MSDNSVSAQAKADVEAPGWLRSEHGRFLGMAGLILGLLVAVYWPALRGSFVWDDLMLVENNLLLKGQFNLLSIWFRTDFPLSNVAFWLQWHVWGNHPAGYHAVNLLLHATSSLLLWRVLRRLSVPGGPLAAIIFAVHPVCVASVAWIAELKNTLSLPFYLLSILFYLRFESAASESTRPELSSGSARPERVAEGMEYNALNAATKLQGRETGGSPLEWYALAFGAFLMALLSKTTTVGLPAVLLVCVWWQRGRLTRRDLLGTAPFFLLGLAFGLLTISFQAHGAIRGATVQTLSFPGRLGGAGMALWFYLGKALWPLNLAMIYPRWQINPAAVLTYAPVALWCCLLGICWYFRHSWGRHVLFSLGTFTFTLFPVLGFLSMYYLVLSRVSDHFEYLPLVSVVALAAGALCSAIAAKALRLVAPALVMVLSLISVQRASVFSNEQALWQDTLNKNPDAWISHANLGWILAAQQKYDEASVHLAKSLELNPYNAQAHCNLGRVLALQGHFPEADRHFLMALKLKPDDLDVRKSYASVLSENGRKEDAAQQLREALKSRPDPDVQLELAELLFETAQFPDAVVQYRQALALRPDVPEALSNLAWLLATSSDSSLRNGTEAVQLAERACRLTGYQQASMVGVLAAAYAEAGSFSNAVSTVQKTIDLATAAGDQRFAAVNRQLLKLFLAGQPYHEAPPRHPAR
jgi:tetratricopeptide (TPR) repeat protein